MVAGDEGRHQGFGKPTSTFPRTAFRLGHYQVGPQVGTRCLAVSLGSFHPFCGPIDPCAAPVVISHWLELCFLVMGVCFHLPFVLFHLHSNNLQGHVELHYSKPNMHVRNASSPLFLRILMVIFGT